MKKIITYLLILVTLMFSVSCPKPEPYSGSVDLVTSSGIKPGQVNIDNNGNVTVDLGSESGNLYLVITNLNKDDTFTNPSVSAPKITGLETPATTKMSASLVNETSGEGHVITDFVDRVVEAPIPLTNDKGVVSAKANVTRWTSPYTNLTEGASRTLYAKDIYDDKDKLVNATLRKKVTVGGKTLFIFVEDSQWGTNGAKLTQDFIDDQAKSFLSDGKNDIWTLDESIFGSVYGDIPGWQDSWTTGFGYTTIATNGSKIDNTNEVVILFLDINETRSTTSGIGGYFSSTHTSVNTNGSGTSNEAVMLFMDSYISKGNPSESKTTMAHEFQHAIHNYQRRLKRGWTLQGNNITLAGPHEATFTTELFSTLAEEMVAHKLGVAGPGNNDKTTGGLPTEELALINGRIAQFLMAERYNLLDYDGVQTAPSTSRSVFPYGLNFSFGAYLVRNYGTGFIKEYLASTENETYISDNSIVEDFEKIASMIATSIQTSMNDSSITWESLLKGWGASLLLSDVYTAAKPYKMSIKNSNNDYWFSDLFYTGNKVASANHYGYSANVDILGSTKSGSETIVRTTGPLVYGSSSDRPYSAIEGKKLHPNTNTFVLVKTGATGTVSGINISNSNDNLRYTFVLK